MKIRGIITAGDYKYLQYFDEEDNRWYDLEYHSANCDDSFEEGCCKCYQESYDECTTVDKNNICLKCEFGNKEFFDKCGGMR